MHCVCVDCLHVVLGEPLVSFYSFSWILDYFSNLMHFPLNLPFLSLFFQS